jgi:hypothetical protein
MMILQGQHGMQQDYPLGLRHIRESAFNADENAPQGAYVSMADLPSQIVLTLPTGVWNATSTRSSSGRSSRSFLTYRYQQREDKH